LYVCSIKKSREQWLKMGTDAEIGIPAVSFVIATGYNALSGK
jgi:hypothetical protein